MILETERLILRPIDPERDFEAWAKTFANPDVMRYLGGEPMNRALAWRSMAMIIGHWHIRGYSFFSLEEKATGAWVGRVGPWNPEGWPEPEVGWTISPDHWRKGFATEAGAAAITYAFETLGWSRVAHCILEGNTPSVATAEKLGSRLLRTEQGISGITKGKVMIYGQEKSS